MSILLWILSTATYVYLIGTFIVATISMCWEGKRVSDLKKAQREEQRSGAQPQSSSLAHLFAPNFGAGHGASRDPAATASTHTCSAYL